MNSNQLSVSSEKKLWVLFEVCLSKESGTGVFKIQNLKFIILIYRSCVSAKTSKLTPIFNAFIRIASGS